MYDLCCEEENYDVPKLSKYCPIRWNSCYEMISSSIQQYAVLNSYEALLRSTGQSPLPLISAQGFTELRTISEFLATFQNCTDAYSIEEELLSAARIRFSLLVDAMYDMKESKGTAVSGLLQEAGKIANTKLTKYFAMQDSKVVYISTV